MNGRVIALHAGGTGLVKRSAALLSVDTEGAVGDRHRGRDAARALLLVSEETYRRLARGGIRLPYGSLGENLVVTGLPAAPLPAGTTLELGAVAAVATGPCTVCRSLRSVHADLPRAVHGMRGTYLRVTGAGTLTAGDPVRLAPTGGRGDTASTGAGGANP